MEENVSGWFFSEHIVATMAARMTDHKFDH